MIRNCVLFLYIGHLLCNVLLRSGTITSQETSKRRELQLFLRVRSPSINFGVPITMEVEEPEQQDSGIRRSKVCAVCGGESQTYHLNFGVGTCNSCRAFFRRSVQVRLLLIEGIGRPTLPLSFQFVHCFRAATLSSTQQENC